MASPAARKLAQQHLLVAGAFLAIALIQTWPLVTHLSTHLPNDLGDPVLNTWLLWWNAHALPLTTRWWNAPMFYPSPGAMAFSEVLLGQALFATPLQWLGASPVFAYNVLFLLSFPLSAFCAYLLAWSLTHRVGPSIVAGAMYGFAMFRFAHIAHLQIEWTWWMPLALFGLHRWFTERRASGLVIFAAAWLGQSLSNGYYFFYFSVIVGLWIAWFTPWRQARRVLLPALLAWAIAVALLAPVLLGYRQIQQRYQFYRSMAEIEDGSADLTEFFRPSSVPRFLHVARWERPEKEVSLPFVGLGALAIGLIAGARGGLRRRGSILAIVQIALWGSALAVALAGASTRFLGNLHFDTLGVHFSGIQRPLGVALPLTILGLALSPAVERAWRARSASAFYLGATVVTIILALGPNPRVAGVKFWYNAPYSWLMEAVPGIAGVRVPARFVLLTVLCLAILTALLLARVRLANAGRERLLFGAIALVALLETWPGAMGLAAVPSLPPDLTQAPAVLELPFGGNTELLALYRSMFHDRPVVNGYSGYFTPGHDVLVECLKRKEVECVADLRYAIGPVDVLIDRQNDPTGEWSQFAAGLPNARLRSRDAHFVVYHLPAPSSSLPSSSAQPLASVQVKGGTATPEPGQVPLAMDQKMETGWSTGRGQQVDDTLTLETESVPLAGIELWPGPRAQDFPMGLVVETSEDGRVWSPAWSGVTAPIRFATLLTQGSPGTRITFTPRQGRFVRLTETVNESFRAWSIAELVVLRTP
jgi:hypothetical protein